MAISSIPSLAGGGGGGTVTSVGLTTPNTTVFDITGSPVITAGDLDIALRDQPANYVLASDPAGTPAQIPDFRALVADDIPAIDSLNGLLAVPGQLDATGTPSASTFLRGDGAWAVPAGSGGQVGVGPVASLPGSPAVGDVYFPTDKNWMYACSSAGVWQAYWHGVPITPTFAADWTYLLNAGTTGTKTDTAGGMLLTKAYQNGIAILGHNTGVPATPYTVEIGLQLIQQPYDFGNTALGLYQSSDTKWEGAGIVTQSAAPIIKSDFSKWTASVFSAGYTGKTTTISTSSAWIRITNDGVDTVGYMCVDGINWTSFQSHASNSWMTTPTSFIIAMQNESNNGATGQNIATIFHYKVS